MFPQQNWIKSIQKSYRLHDSGPQFLKGSWSETDWSISVQAATLQRPGDPRGLATHDQVDVNWLVRIPGSDPEMLHGRMISKAKKNTDSTV